MNEGIKDIRVVQKLKNRARLKEVDGEMVVGRWVEKTSYTIQIKRDGFAAEWEDVPVIEEYEDDD
jgi:dTDP-glucose pyrophosphorylase